MRSLCMKWSMVLAVFLAMSGRALALDGATVIVNEGVSAGSLTAAALKDIYTGKTMYWDGGQAVVIVVVSDKTDSALEAASGMNASSFKTFWQRLAFSGRGQQPKKVDDAAAAVTLVSSTKGAIAIIPAGADAKGVKTVEVK